MKIDTMRPSFARLGLTLALCFLSPTFAYAANPKSPREIAAASRLLAERSAACRTEAKSKKLHFGKRRAFLRQCMK